MSAKSRSIAILIFAQVSALGLWFVSSAILPDMLREVEFSQSRQAALASSVSLGFVLGAMVSAILGLPDRFDPRKLFSICAIISSLSGLGLLVVEPGGNLSIAMRFLTGIMLAGVYPVGMKLAIGWGQKDRGLLVGLLVGALTLGSASPHLVAYLGQADWRLTIQIISLLTLVSAGLILFSGLGPFHAKALSFQSRAIFEAWTNKRVRYAYLGYFGHMWELYAMWAWIGLAAFVSYKATMSDLEALSLSKLTAFLVVAVGGLFCVIGGYFADKIGKAKVAIIAMWVSGLSAIATALSFSGPPWLTFFIMMIWGASIVPDSPQFSALVADGSRPQIAGSLMTFQTAIGFLLTFFTVQMIPYLTAAIGWPWTLSIMALGPLFGIYFMRKLEALDRDA